MLEEPFVKIVIDKLLEIAYNLSNKNYKKLLYLLNAFLQIYDGSIEIEFLQVSFWF